MANSNWPAMGGGGGGGVVTGAANVGTGVGLFQVLSAGILDFRSITDGTGISWVQNVNDVQATISLAPFSTTNLAEGTNLYFTNERVDDRVAALIQNGTGITWTYNDVANTLTGNVSLAPFSTTNLTEGTNLYYTQARFDTAFAAKSTTDLAEGTNLYFTQARARTSVSGTAPVSYNSGTGVFSMHVADSTHDGYLSAADFVTFSNASPAVVTAVSSNISLVNNHIYLVDTTAARTLTLPSPVTGNRIVLKDATGTASTNPIALTPFAGEKIDGTAAAYSLNYDFGAWEAVSDGTDWYLI